VRAPDTDSPVRFSLWSVVSVPSSSVPSALPSPAASHRGFLLVVLAALCWGTAGVSGRLVAERTGLGALDIAWYRMAVAAVALIAMHLATGRRRRSVPAVPITRPLVVRIALCGAGLGAYQLAFFAAVAYSGVSIPTLVALGLAPLFIAVGGSLLGHGRPDGTTLGALVVALVGLVLLVGITAGAGAGTSVLLGALLASGSGLGYAVVTLAGAGVPAGVPVTMAAFSFGALLLTPAALVSGIDVPHDGIAVALLLYLGLVPSAIAYRFFFAGIRSVPGPVASIVTLLEPLTATVLATSFLGERLTAPALAGGLLVLSAVAALYLRRMGDSNSRGVAPNPLSKRAP
jgi:DME family drug/metabolite transporter